MENEVVKATLGEALAEVTTALKGAVKEYGPDAVDLALFAYRVDAVQYLLLGFVGVAIIIGTILAYRALWQASKSWDDTEGAILARVVCGGVMVVAWMPAFFEGALRLVSAPHWVAAFGHPELLIATNALKAAGLL